ARHFFRAHERHHAAVAGVQEDVLDPAALGRLEDVRPRDLPAQLGGVELDRAIEVESRQPQMMNARALHSLASWPLFENRRQLTTNTPQFRVKDSRTIVQDPRSALSPRESICA